MKLKVNEVASQLGESPNVIRNWVRDFKQHIPIEKADNGYNWYPPEAVAVLLSIQKMAREQNYSTRQIEYYLSGGELAAAVESEPESSVAVAPSVEVAELKEMMQQLLAQQQEQQKQQQEFSKALLAQLDKRDKQLTDFIVERRLEQKQQQQEETKPKSWWKRLF